MNIETRIDGQKGLRTIVLRGESTLPDIQTFIKKLYRLGDFEPAYHALWDVREAIFPAVAPGEVKELACFLRGNWNEKQQRKTAVVVSGDFHFGLSRMLEQFVGPHADGRFRTFRDFQAAVDWIEGKATVSPLPTSS